MALLGLGGIWDAGSSPRPGRPGWPWSRRRSSWWCWWSGLPGLRRALGDRRHRAMGGPAAAPAAVALAAATPWGRTSWFGWCGASRERACCATARSCWRRRRCWSPRRSEPGRAGAPGARGTPARSRRSSSSSYPSCCCPTRRPRRGHRGAGDLPRRPRPGGRGPVGRAGHGGDTAVACLPGLRLDPSRADRLRPRAADVRRGRGHQRLAAGRRRPRAGRELAAPGEIGRPSRRARRPGRCPRSG